MLVEKIREYLDTHTIQELHHETGICTGVFYSLLKRDWKKYSKNNLDILYKHFGLERDQFYKDNIKKWYPKTPSLFGTFIRYKRLQMEIDLHELSKMVRVDERALARLESGDALPTFDSWTIQHIFDALNFTDEEKTMTKIYIDNMKWLEKTIKKYDI